MTTTIANTIPAGALVPACPSWCTVEHDLFDWEIQPSEGNARLYHQNHLCYDIYNGLGVRLVAGQFVTASPKDGQPTSRIEPVTAQVETETGDWSADDLERAGRMLLDAAAKMRELLSEEAGR